MRNVFAIVSLLLSAQLVADKVTKVTESAPNAKTKSSTQIDADVARAPVARREQQAVRASEIIGTPVKNESEEELGAINDLVIDPVDGRIAYAAVSMGGFLGVGDKLFAVPWDAIECRKVDDDHVAILEVDKKAMENARGFDESDWPNMADARWRTENDRPYKLRRARTHEALRPIQQPEARQGDAAPVQQQ
jgi:sporulation protein YlmC with PRC-barrel domain